MPIANPRTIFGDRLRDALEREGLSIRALARRMNPEHPETARRNLMRWLGGTAPEPANRRLVAEALGVDPRHFDEGDDEEEAELVRDVVDALHRLLERRREHEREVA
jgi:transcriptional regulator with XRE-family HTH domain